MAQQSFTLCCILHLLLLSMSVFGKAKGEICKDDLGACDASCPSKCASAHPGGQSSCSGGTVQTCQCFYDCGPPQPPSPPTPSPPPPPPPPGKRCNIGLGPCSFKCSDDCCDLKCAARYPGKDGHGMCMKIIPPYNLCYCTFICP